jgi:hypothetical protein
MSRKPLRMYAQPSTHQRKHGGRARFSQIDSLISGIMHASSAVVFEYREPTKPLEVDELRFLRCQAERFTQSVSIPSTTLGILAPSIPIDIADEFESEPKPVDGDDFNLVEVDGAKFKHARACFVNGKRSCLWSLDLHLGPAYRNGVLPFTWENHTRSRRLLGQSLTPRLILETSYAGSVLSLVSRQDTVSLKPPSTPLQCMHFDKLSYFLAASCLMDRRYRIHLSAKS